MKKIIYATDLSENSVMGLKYAEALCTKTNAQLIVLNVFEIPTILSSPTEAATFPQIEKGVEKEVNDKIRAFCRNHLLTENYQIQSVSNNSIVDGIDIDKTDSAEA